MASTKKLTTHQWIEKARLTHGNKYDYSLVEYKNCMTKVKIICLKHGIFKQTPNNHDRGQTCKKCDIETIGDRFRSNIDKFIDKSNVIHNFKYDYSLVSYIGNKIKVEIVCKNCNKSFYVRPDNHIHGSGCPRCRESSGENRIYEWLESNNIIYKRQKCFDNCINKIKLRFDFYLPDFKLAIEYDGQQHFKSVRFGGCSAEDANENLKEQKIKDTMKNNYCSSNQIGLLRIPYWKFNSIEKILEKKINEMS
jgi:hypothetical protein